MLPFFCFFLIIMKGLLTRSLLFCNEQPEWLCHNCCKVWKRSKGQQGRYCFDETGQISSKFWGIQESVWSFWGLGESKMATMASLKPASRLPKLLLNLKGVWHQIFDFRFFSWIIVTQAPKYSIGAVETFFENLRRYTRMNVFTGVNNPGK